MTGSVYKVILKMISLQMIKNMTTSMKEIKNFKMKLSHQSPNSIFLVVLLKLILLQLLLPLSLLLVLLLPPWPVSKKLQMELLRLQIFLLFPLPLLLLVLVLLLNLFCTHLVRRCLINMDSNFYYQGMNRDRCCYGIYNINNKYINHLFSLISKPIISIVTFARNEELCGTL